MTPSADRPHGLAAYAVSDERSRGRVHAESGASGPPFEIDRRRIIHCMAFRRLMYKTQVFVSDAGDHFRTRLTHTLEVAMQARRVARRLALHEGLAEATALAHDLGHSPFGHAGEAALRELMTGHGGFEHNVQSLRVVDYLEHPNPEFRGLNLSFELRESLIKHRTRFDRPDGGEPPDDQTRPLLEAGPSPPLEGQVVNLADTMAYTLHDIEDGIGQGALDESALDECAIWREAAEHVRGSRRGLSLHTVRRPILDRLADHLVADAERESRGRLARGGIETVDDARACEEDVIAFSEEVQTGVGALQNLLTKSVYRNHRVVRMDSKARRIIRELFQAYLAEPELLPARFGSRIREQGDRRVICDYIAGMTDRFCQQEHQRLFAPFHFE